MKYSFFILFMCFLNINKASAGSSSLTNKSGDSLMSQPLYIKTFGNINHQPIVFIHGGPGHDSQNFEYSTAETLAEKGFFVVVYDQRGQGRSPLASKPEVYNYETYSEDLKNLILDFKLSKPVLIGHSHGGAIALKFDNMYPDLAESIVLVGAPIKFWSSILSIYENCKKRYESQGKISSLSNLQLIFSNLKKQDLSDLEKIQNIGMAFQHGLKCGLYEPKNPSSESKKLQQIVSNNYVQVHQNNLMYPMGNFIIYEDYHVQDHSQLVEKSSAKIYGVYGVEDGLFTPSLLQNIEELLSKRGQKRFFLVTGSSHNVFIDQQRKFLDIIEKISK